MDKDRLLRVIANTGYNVGFGAKKHFATFDIVEKAPGWIGLFSTTCGIFGLVFEVLSSKEVSALLLIVGISALYISFYKSKEYEVVGIKLIVIFNSLRDLYYDVQSGADVEQSFAKLKEIEQEFYACSISKQILFSDWYAHLKFFYQTEINWIDEQLRFEIWRDKVPGSARLLLFFIILCLAISIVISIILRII